MKKNIPKIFAAIVVLILSVTFTILLFSYAKPMKNQSYDLSVFMEDGGTWDKDTKGWTVFTQEGETRKLLTPNDFASYVGFDYAGQTFYYSRTLSELLDSPALKVNVANRNISVFLDDELLYTDCPELNNKIGALTLPMREFDKAEPITISLPSNYHNKTLTIAQSTGQFYDGSTANIEATLCFVTLYCGYAYESELIAESHTAAIITTFYYILGIICLVIFLRQMFRKQIDISTLLLTLIAFLKMILQQQKPSYYYFYHGIPSFFISAPCKYMIIGLLLLYLTFKAGKYKKILYVFDAVYFIALFLVYGIKKFIPLFPSISIDGAALLPFILIIILGILFWSKENTFYRSFTPLVCTLILLYIIFVPISPYRKSEYTNFLKSIQALSPTFITYRLKIIIETSTYLTAIFEFISYELSRYSEQKMVHGQNRMIHKSYEALYQHNEEIMMIRHDMSKHLTLLNQMNDLAQMKAYLQPLIEQNNQIAPFIHTNNDMMNIILNGLLGPAKEHGVTINLNRTVVPKTLPLSDTDYSSLFMNIIENAVEATQNHSTQNAYITLDMHTKNDLFIFTCENSVHTRRKRKINTKKTVPKHGLGLRIIQQICSRYEILSEITFETNSYKITLAIPLDHSSK